MGNRGPPPCSIDLAGTFLLHIVLVTGNRGPPPPPIVPVAGPPPCVIDLALAFLLHIIPGCRNKGPPPYAIDLLVAFLLPELVGGDVNIVPTGWTIVTLHSLVDRSRSRSRGWQGREMMDGVAMFQGL